MPVLDKLTTIVEWDVDTGELSRYENLVTQSEAATIDLGAAAAAADVEISGISSAAVAALSKDVVIANAGLAKMAEGAKAAGSATDQAAARVEQLSRSTGKLKIQSNSAAAAARTLNATIAGYTAASAAAIAKAEALAKSNREVREGFVTLGADISGTFGMIAKIGGAVAGIFTSLGLASSRQIGVQTRLAASVGMTTESYLAWDGVLAQMGMSGERVVDMVEETSNKLGELKGLGEMSSAQDALKMLGMEFANIKDLAPQDQFREIMSAAKDLGDESVARSAVDMIFGGDANKVLGHLRTLDGSLEDILRSYQKYNFLTAEGISGSTQLADTIKNVTTAGKTLLAEVMGRLAENLGPVIDKFFDWTLANRELINQKIESTVRAIADALRWVAWGAEKIIKLVDALGGAGNLIKEVAVAFAAWKIQSWVTQLSALAAKMELSGKAMGAMKAASEGLKKIGLAGLFTAAYLALEDLYYFLTGGKSAIGRFMDEQLPKAEAAMLHFFGVLDDNMTAQEQRDVTAGFQQGFIGGIEHVKGFFGTAATIADQFFGNIGGTFALMGADIAGFFGGVGDSVFAFFQGIAAKIADVFYNAVNGMRDAIRDLPIVGGLVGDGDVKGSYVGKVETGRGSIPKFGGGGMTGLQTFNAPDFAWAGAGGVSPVASPAKSGGVVNNSSMVVNAPVNVTAQTGASAREIASEVGRQMSRTFADVKTTGIRR